MRVEAGDGFGVEGVQREGDAVEAGDGSEDGFDEHRGKVSQKREQPSGGGDFDIAKTGALQESTQAVFGEAQIIARFVVQVRQMRHAEQQRSSRFQAAVKLAHGPFRVGNVFEHLQAKDRIEALIPQRDIENRPGELQSGTNLDIHRNVQFGVVSRHQSKRHAPRPGVQAASVNDLGKKRTQNAVQAPASGRKAEIRLGSGGIVGDAFVAAFDPIVDIHRVG